MSRREVAAVFGLGFAAGLIVAMIMNTSSSSAPAFDARTVLLDRPRPCLPPGWRGAKPMDPPVLPRVFNALNATISEENLQATVNLLLDTPRATVRRCCCCCAVSRRSTPLPSQLRRGLL
jgi:hypothetical protein